MIGYEGFPSLGCLQLLVAARKEAVTLLQEKLRIHKDHRDDNLEKALLVNLGAQLLLADRLQHVHIILVCKQKHLQVDIRNLAVVHENERGADLRKKV